MCYKGRNMKLFLNSYVNVLINFTFFYQLTSINSCGRIELASLMKPCSSWTPLSPEPGGAHFFHSCLWCATQTEVAFFRGALCWVIHSVAQHGVTNTEPELEDPGSALRAPSHVPHSLTHGTTQQGQTHVPTGVVGVPYVVLVLGWGAPAPSPLDACGHEGMWSQDSQIYPP